MDELDLFSWAIGFWEGEGSVGSPQGAYARYLRINADQNTREPLERMLEVFGGSIKARHPSRSGRIIYRWQVQGAFAWTCADRMMPHLSERRQEQLREHMERSKDQRDAAKDGRTREPVP